MDEEIIQKVANLTNALYEAGYIDDNKFTLYMLNWTDKGQAFMKEKFGDLWSIHWPNYSHPDRVWLPHLSIERGIENIKQGITIDSPRDYWEYVKFPVAKWEYDRGDQRYDLLIKLLGFNDVDYIELDDLVL